MNHENLMEVGPDPDQDKSVNEQASRTTFLADLQHFT